MSLAQVFASCVAAVLSSSSQFAIAYGHRLPRVVVVRAAASARTLSLLSPPSLWRVTAEWLVFYYFSCSKTLLHAIPTVKNIKLFQGLIRQLRCFARPSTRAEIVAPCMRVVNQAFTLSGVYCLFSSPYRLRLGVQRGWRGVHKRCVTSRTQPTCTTTRFFGRKRASCSRK